MRRCDLRYQKQTRRLEESYPGNFGRLLRLDRERRKNETESENDHEPDQPHEHLVGGWLAGV